MRRLENILSAGVIAAQLITGFPVGHTSNHFWEKSPVGMTQIIEDEPIISDYLEEFTQKRSAYKLLEQLSSEGKLDTSIPIGWIDYTNVDIFHKAFTSSDGLNVFDHPYNNQRNILGGNTDHATGALQFAIQEGSGGETGLCQAQWGCRVLFSNIYSPESNSQQSEFVRYANTIKDLIDSGVGVIGTIPTWRESDNLTPDDRKAIEDAYYYAQLRQVLIVIPAGNANQDLNAVQDKRILHELAKKYGNVVVAGGTDKEGHRAVWADDKAGSNYGIDSQGKPYVDIWSPIWSRKIPYGEGFSSNTGTTYATGDIVSALYAIQSTIGRTSHGDLPPWRNVLRILELNSRVGSGSNNQNIRFVQMADAVKAAVNYRNNHIHLSP